MQSGSAPDGFETYVSIVLHLRNGKRPSYAWSTQMGLTAAAHRSLKWAKEEMSQEKIPGRSQIVGYEVFVEFQRKS